MKKTICFLVCLLCLAGCSQSNDPGPTDRRPMVMVDDVLYLDTGEEIPGGIDDASILGTITSSVPRDELPSQNGEGNFDGIGAQYARYEDGLAILLQGKWFFFEPEVSHPGNVESVSTDAPESTSDYAGIYTSVFDSYFEFDPGLHDGMTYIAIDMNTLEHASGADKAAIAEHLAEQFGMQTMDASMNDLQEKGYVGEGGSLEGILLSIESVTVTEDTITVEGSKYRSGLGANGFESILVRMDGVWALDSTVMTWIS